MTGKVHGCREREGRHRCWLMMGSPSARNCPPPRPPASVSISSHLRDQHPRMSPAPKLWTTAPSSPLLLPTPTIIPRTCYCPLPRCVRAPGASQSCGRRAAGEACETGRAAEERTSREEIRGLGRRQLGEKMEGGVIPPAPVPGPCSRANIPHTYSDRRGRLPRTCAHAAAPAPRAAWPASPPGSDPRRLAVRRRACRVGRGPRGRTAPEPPRQCRSGTPGALKVE